MKRLGHGGDGPVLQPHPILPLHDLMIMRLPSLTPVPRRGLFGVGVGELRGAAGASAVRGVIVTAVDGTEGDVAAAGGAGEMVPDEGEDGEAGADEAAGDFCVAVGSISGRCLRKMMRIYSGRRTLRGRFPCERK